MYFKEVISGFMFFDSLVEAQRESVSECVECFKKNPSEASMCISICMCKQIGLKSSTALKNQV